LESVLLTQQIICGFELSENPRESHESSSDRHRKKRIILSFLMISELNPEKSNFSFHKSLDFGQECITIVIRYHSVLDVDMR
jgi:hypothetical protein